MSEKVFQYLIWFATMILIVGDVVAACSSVGSSGFITGSDRVESVPIHMAMDTSHVLRRKDWLWWLFQFAGKAILARRVKISTMVVHRSLVERSFISTQPQHKHKNKA